MKQFTEISKATKSGVNEIYFYIVTLGSVAALVFMALLFSAFLNREIKEKETWKHKYEELVKINRV